MKFVFKPFKKRKLFSKTFIFASHSRPMNSDEYILLKDWHENSVDQYNGKVSCFSQDIFNVVDKQNLSDYIITTSTTKELI
jgi:hypothetical protein